MTDPLLGNVLRLRAKAKKVANTRVRTPFRHRRKGIKLTKEERETRQRDRNDNRVKFNSAVAQARDTIMELAEKLAEDFPKHDKDYYYRHLMQLPKVTEAKRPITEWHAFMHLKMKERNQTIVDTQGEEARRDRVSSDTVKEIAAEWKELSPEQKTTITADTVKELEERRANRVEGKHNTQLAACHDARATLKNIKTELDNLHARTGVSILFMVTRGEIEVFGNPVTYHSDERVAHFVESTTGTTLEDTAIRLEAYCLMGLEGAYRNGVVTNQLRRTQDLKTMLKDLIGTKLQLASNGAVNRMNYVNFDTAITAKAGVVLENWPLIKFQCPSGMSHTEAEICFRAWDSGTTRFRQLSEEEWKAWMEARYTFAPAGETTESASHPSEEESASRPSTPEPAAPTPSSLAASPPAENPTEPLGTTTTSATVTAPTGTLGPATSLSGKRATEVAGNGPPAKRARTEPMAINFVNSVAPAVGAAFVVPKATRKKRSDAGIPRGPRKQRAAAASENAAPAEEATVVARPKPRPRKKASPQEAPAAPGPSSSSSPAQ